MKTFTSNEVEIPTILNEVYPEVDEGISPCSTEEVKELIFNLKPKKAPGFDLITSEILRQISHNTLQALTSVINACLRLCYVPTLWKVAEVIMVPKPGKPPNDITSYRPISLLPILSKLLEKLFLKKLMPIILANDLTLG